MNKQRFVELCRGDFGRKVATTDVDAITKENVVEVLGSTIHILNLNRPLMKYL